MSLSPARKRATPWVFLFALAAAAGRLEAQRNATLPVPVESVASEQPSSSDLMQLEIEMVFVRRVCAPAPKQLGEIRKDLLKSLTEAASAPAPIPCDVYLDRLNDTVASHLSRSEAAGYRLEVKKRRAHERDACVEMFVAILDEQMGLSEQPRQALVAALLPKWPRDWSQTVEVAVATGDRTLPPVPDEVFGSLLDAEEKRIWQEWPKNPAVRPVFTGLRIGSVGEVISVPKAPARRVNVPLGRKLLNRPPGGLIHRWTNEQLDGKNYRSALEARLHRRVEEFARITGLSQKEKMKLLLAGQGDIHRFRGRLEELKTKSETQHPDTAGLNRREQEIESLLSAARQGVVEDSLFTKTLSKVLTPADLARIEAWSRFQHRAGVQMTALRLSTALGLTDEQRRRLEDVLLKETRPTQISGTPFSDAYFLADYVQLNQIPEERWKPLFEPWQWQALQWKLAQRPRYVALLQRRGITLDEDNR